MWIVYCPGYARQFFTCVESMWGFIARVEAEGCPLASIQAVYVPQKQEKIHA
jgi:hypothetical protein